MRIGDIPKPPHGAACNNCGQCCADVLCPLGSVVFKREVGPCPALETSAGGWGCGLVLRPMRYAPAITAVAGVDRTARAAAFLIGAGKGCDALGHDEPPNDEWRAQIIAAPPDRREVKEAMDIWHIVPEAMGL